LFYWIAHNFNLFQKGNGYLLQKMTNSLSGRSLEAILIPFAKLLNICNVWRESHRQCVFIVFNCVA